MALVGPLIKRTIDLSTRFQIIHPTILKQQQKVLKRLLRKAAYTKFGLNYQFADILRSENLMEEFRNRVPVYTYNTIYDQWWHRTLEGEVNVCWPGHTKYFALSSGTSETASKRIPLTADMIRAIKRGTIKQFLSAHNFKMPANVFEKKIMMLGGSTSLNKKGDYFEGDLSGVSAKKIPMWFHVFYKPGRKIAKEKDWDRKLDDIARKASKWDVSIIVGVPAWIQIMLERIIEYNDVENIHAVWPNLKIYVHSGVSFEPYRHSFKKMIGQPVIDIDTYLASEGFIGFVNRPNAKGMRMLLSNGIYYEFVPFDENNFDADGEILPTATALHIGEVKEGKQYALLLSTCAGTWRYVIGDVIEFVDLSNAEIKISGRTKHYLSLTGEHLSVDNMNGAIEQVNKELNADVKEFTVAGIPNGSLFAHHWWLGCDQKVNATEVKQILDRELCKLNDDYATERTAALKEIIVDVIPSEKFIAWMRFKGKLGGQHKFPRVLKKEQMDEWQKFLSES